MRSLAYARRRRSWISFGKDGSDNDISNRQTRTTTESTDFEVRSAPRGVPRYSFSNRRKSTNRRGESSRLRDSSPPSFPARHRTASSQPSRLSHGHRTRRTLNPDWDGHGPSDMDCRTGTRHTGRRVDGEPAATRLVQDPGAAATQGDVSFTFQQRYPSRAPVVRMRSPAWLGKEKGGPRGRDTR